MQLAGVGVGVAEVQVGCSLSKSVPTRMICLNSARV